MASKIKNLEEAKEVAQYLKDNEGDLSPEQHDKLIGELEAFEQERQAAQPQAQPDQPGRLSLPNEPTGTGQRINTLGKELVGVLPGAQKVAVDVADYAALAVGALSDNPEVQAWSNRARQRADEARKEIEQNYSENLAELYGPDASAIGVGKFVGEMLAYGPAAWGMRGKTFTRVAGSNTLLGSLAGGAGATENAESFQDTLFSTSLGGLLGLGSSALMAGKGVRHYAAQKYSEQLDRELGKQTIALEKEIQRITGDPDFAFTVGQITADNPYMIGIELGAVGEESIKRSNQTIGTLVNYLQRQGRNMDSTEVVEKLHSTMNRIASTHMRTARRNHAAQIEHIADTYGDQVVVNGRQYLDDLREFRGELGDVREFGSRMSTLDNHIEWLTNKVEPFVARRSGKGTWQVIDRRTGQTVQDFGEKGDEAVKSVQARNAKEGLTAEDTVAVMRGHNKLIAGQASPFEAATQGSAEHVGKALKAKFLASLRGQTGDAVRAIQKANKSYQTDMAKLRALENSALGTIFGGDDTVLATLQADPDAALTRLTQGRTKEALTPVRKILETHAPTVLEDLKRATMSRVLHAARDPAMPTSRTTEETLEGLASALSGRGRDASAGRVGIGLFTPKEQNELIKVGQALRTLTNTYVRQASKPTPEMAADIGINLASRSSEFMTRLLVRMGSRGAGIERLMVDPVARQNMIDLAAAKPDSTAFKAAAASLAYRLGQSMAAAKAEDQKPREAAGVPRRF